MLLGLPCPPLSYMQTAALIILSTDGDLKACMVQRICLRGGSCH